MSRAATEQNLFSLLPGINTLPVELVALTNSLLSQSRTKAPNLRPDEEIARGYVVANIACERLKTRLDLPDIIPKPPCPRRVYVKVLGYLSSALAAAPAAAQQSGASPAAGHKRAPPERGAAPPSSSPAGKRARTDDGRALAQQQRQQQQRDLREPEQQQDRQRASHGPHPRQDGHGHGGSAARKQAQLPAWTTRFARALCAPSPAGGSLAWLTGHVVAGLETIVASSVPSPSGPAPAPADPGAPSSPAPPATTTPRRRGRPPGTGRKQAALAAAAAAADSPTARLAALTLAVADVAARAAGLAPLVAGGGGAGAAAAAAEALGPLEDAGAFAPVQGGGSDGGGESVALAAAAVDARALELALKAALQRADDEGWLDAEWANNVRAVASDMRSEGEPAAAAAGADDDRRGDDERERVRLGAGGGEMLLFAEDWLSAERMRGFAAWKAGILSKIEAMAHHH